MKRTAHVPILGLLTILLCGFFLAGCAGNPVAVHPPLYTQEKITAVDHWDNIAEKVAKRIFAIYEQRNDLIAKPVYVRQPNGMPFSTAFSQLLKARLIDKGMQISERREADSIILDYDIQAILHDPAAMSESKSILASLGIGFVNLFAGKYTTSTDTELIISTHMTHMNRYVLHLTTVVYIPEEDLSLYIWTNPYETQSDSSRTIRVIGK